MLCSFGANIHALPLLLEGPVGAFVANPDGSGDITVMGVQVHVPSGVSVSTPTAILTIAKAAEDDPLPGRTQPGFISGTAIIEGAGDVVNGYTADSVFLEPAENVLAAEVSGMPIAIGGLPMEELTDNRLPADPFLNDFGFEVDPETVPVGSAAVTEGYLGNDGISNKLYYFSVVVSAGTLIKDGTTEVSITRAQCILGDPNGIELRIQGATHDPNAGVVTISDTDNAATVYGATSVIADPQAPLFATYSFILRGDPQHQICPDSVTAEFNGATASSAVD